MKKNNTYVLVTVFVVIVLCVISYFYLKSRENNEANIILQAQSKDTKVIENLEEILSKAKFVNNQKEDVIDGDFSNSNMAVKIENDTIVIRVLDKSVNITSIKKPVSVSTFYVSGDDGIDADVYVLNEKKDMYHIIINNDKTKIILFALPDIESYSTNVKMLDNREDAINFVVAKGTNGLYYTDYKFVDDSEYTLREIISKKIEEEPEEDEEITYGIYSTKEVDPFKNLNFNSRVIAPEGKEIDFDSKAVTYNGWYYESDDDESPSERSQKVVINVKNVKQAGLNCEIEGPCSKIYYLLSSGELYEVVALEEGYFQKDDDGSYKKSTILIDKNVKSFALTSPLDSEEDTNTIVYRKSDGKTYVSIMGKSYNADNYKRQMISNAYEYPLYIVSNKAKITNPVKTKDGKNLVAKKIYSFEGAEEDGDGASFAYIYVLNEDDYIYEIDDYVKDKATKYSDKKVKSITERDDDILITYTDNSTDVIDAYLEYEAK